MGLSYYKELISLLLLILKFSNVKTTNKKPWVVHLLEGSNLTFHHCWLFEIKMSYISLVIGPRGLESERKNIKY